MTVYYVWLAITEIYLICFSFRQALNVAVADVATMIYPLSFPLTMMIVVDADVAVADAGDVVAPNQLLNSN